MRSLMRKIMPFLRDSRGATTVEYAFILAMIVLAIMAALVALADATNGMWGNVNTKVQQVTK